MKETHDSEKRHTSTRTLALNEESLRKFFIQNPKLYFYPDEEHFFSSRLLLYSRRVLKVGSYKNWSDSKENKNIIKTEDLHLFVLRKSQAAAKSFVYKKSSTDHQQQVNKPTQER